MPEYVARLASLRRREDAAARRSPTGGDALRLAVLAALNIADELFRCRDDDAPGTAQLAERAGELERLLDRVLGVLMRSDGAAGWHAPAPRACDRRLRTKILSGV